MDRETELPTSTNGRSGSEMNGAVADSTLAEALERRPVVEVSRIGNREQLQIHVVCAKRPGILAEIAAMLEGAGLLLIESQISAYDHVNFDAVGVQDRGEEMSATAITSLLLDLILNRDGPSVATNAP